MKKPRRPLTEDERIWAKNLKREWLAKKATEKITQEQAADEFGWTQGAIGQYINGKIPLNTDAIRMFAGFLGIPVTKIAPELNDLPLATKNRREELERLSEIELLDLIFHATDALKSMRSE